MRAIVRAAMAVVLPLILALPPAAAQGIQTGEIIGTVSSSDGLTLPGATVTARSAALQGERTVTTDQNGNFVLRALPPGAYEVTFEMSGLSPRTEKVTVELGRQSSLNPVLRLAGVTEAVTVTAESPTATLTSPSVGANYDAREINTLPTGRTPALIAELAPGLTNNTPNAGQVTISGGFAYDNVFMINGVDVNDNVFGTANNVFIEDAIEQTTVLTSGISAEYGRFSGGVINMITKSGGNDFTGSFRANLTNDAWTKETPREVEAGTERQDKLNQNYEGTFGGPIIRDRAWFFGAGRWQESDNQTNLQQTNVPFTTTTKNQRFEIKGTGTIVPNHTLIANYIRNTTDTTRLPFGFTIDPLIAETPSFPNDLAVVSYNGVLSDKMLVNFQVSQKDFGFRGSGGSDTNILNSPFLTRGVTGIPATLHYNGNYFDATDPEDRNNRQFAGSLAYFASTPGWGSHDIKGGFEHFTSNRTGGNSQSATNYVFLTDYLTSGGAPVLDAQGRLIPIFTPGVTRVENWLATRGANLDVRTLSLFVQDNWSIGRNLTINAGVRYENVRSEATGGIIGVDTDTIVPRLAATYDLTGDGRTVLQASYAHYAGKYNESQIGQNSPVGNPALVLREYSGPAGQGRDFAPGFDPANYTEILGGSFPTANVFLNEGVSSPVTREFTVSIGRQLWNRGLAKLTYTNRSYSNLIEDFIDDPSLAGRTNVVFEGTDFGTFDNIVFGNSDVPERDYQAMLLQANFRPLSRLTLEGHWTLQLRNHGNFEGEGANTPGISSSIGDYPEILVPERNFPTGRLNDFQRHKVRLWAIWNQGLGRFGSVDIAPIVRIDSGTTYSLFANGVPLSDVQLARDPGYAQLPGGGEQTLFFGERGSETFPGFALMDLAVNYSVPVFRTLSPWVKVEMLNVTNNQKLIAFNTTVTPDPNSPLDANGLPTGFIRGARFGQATANTHYPVWRPGFSGGRTFLVSAGLRF